MLFLDTSKSAPCRSDITPDADVEEPVWILKRDAKGRYLINKCTDLWP